MLHVSLFAKFLLLFKILDRGHEGLAEKADLEENVIWTPGGKSSPKKEWQVQGPTQEIDGVFMEQCRGLDHSEGARVGEVEADCGGRWFRSLLDYLPQKVIV